MLHFIPCWRICCDTLPFLLPLVTKMLNPSFVDTAFHCEPSSFSALAVPGASVLRLAALTMVLSQGDGSGTILGDEPTGSFRLDSKKQLE